MKFAILAVCVAVVAAKPHVYLFNGRAPLSASASSSSSSSSSQTVYSKNVRGYQGPPAPLGGDGRVVDTADVAQLKAERLAALHKATADAQASAVASLQSQDGPTFIVQADHQGHSGTSVPIGQNSRVINTEEVGNLTAEDLATFADAQAKVAAFVITSSASSSAETYSHESPVIGLKYLYKGPAAPLGQNGRVVDTDEVAKLKAERIATLEKARTEAVASAAKSSSSSESYSYEAAIGQNGRRIDTDEVAKLKAKHIATLEKTYSEAALNSAESSSFDGHFHDARAQKTIPALTYETASVQVQPQQTYTGPFATVGEDGRVVDTDEVAKLKTEHLATLAKAHAEAAAIENMEAAMAKSSTDGYHYEAPAVKFEAIPSSSPSAAASEHQQLIYNGPTASLGQDGRVIDTDEVASLKAERIATLEKAHAEAAASSAEASSSSEGYYYEAPIQKVQTILAPTYGAPVHKIEPIPVPAYGVPIAQPEKRYNGPFATIGQDGRVVDTEEVAKLKAEHLATLAKANAEASAIEAMEAAAIENVEAAMAKSSTDSYHYEAPAVQFEVFPSSTPGAPASEHQQLTYNGPTASLGQDGRVIDTDEVASLKAERIATLKKAHAEAAASSADKSSSSEGYYYEAPIQKVQTILAPTYGAPVHKIEPIPVPAYGVPIAQPEKRYNGPFATIGQDGRVVDTEEVAKLKAEHLATLAEAHAEAAAIEAMEAAAIENVEADMAKSSTDSYHYDAPAVKFEAISSSTPGAPASEHQQLTYNGPTASLGQDGRVIDTDEVASLKAERIATLEKAHAEAAASSADASSSSEGYYYEAPIQKVQTILAPIYGAPVHKIEPIPVPAYSVPIAQPEKRYNGPFATIGQDGRVVDTEEVAKLKAEHLATLAKAHAEAAAIEAMEAAAIENVEAAMAKSSTDSYHYDAPAVKFEAISSSTPGAPASEHQQLTYNGPTASLGQDGRVIDTDEVASLKAERIATLEKAHAEAAASSADASSSSEGYYYEAPIQKVQTILAPIYGAPVHKIEPIPVPAYSVPIAQPEKRYNGPFATIGQDGRVVDTEEVAKLKAEHLATWAKAHAEAAAIEAMEAAAIENVEAAMAKSSTDGYHYEAPAVKFEAIPSSTPGAPASEHQQLTYNGPIASLGEDGRVIDTDEVASLKAERIATLEKAHAEAVASSADASSSSEGYYYEAPIQKIQAIPAPIYGAPVHKIQPIPVPAYGVPIAQPEKRYNGPFATIGQDGRVVETEEVSKLKAEHIATLEKAHAAAAAAAVSEAASISSSEEHHYEAPIWKTEAIPASTYGAPVAQPHKIYNGPAAPLGQDGRVIDTDEVEQLKTEHIATLEKANAAAAAFEATSSSSSEGYHYDASIQETKAILEPTHGTPVAPPQKIYNGPPAPLGQDGRVIDTDEVARLKADHIATLEKANAAAAALEASSSSSSSEQGYSYEAPVAKLYLPAPAVPAETYGPSITKIQQTYGAPPAPLSQHGQVIDTQEVAQLKAEHIATLAQANARAEASAASASSSSSASSSAEVTYGAPAVQQFEPIIKRYSGPLAPLAADGTVVDTAEVARLKADHLATLKKATDEAIAHASTEVTENIYSPPLPAQKPYRRSFRSY